MAEFTLTPGKDGKSMQTKGLSWLGSPAVLAGLLVVLVGWFLMDGLDGSTWRYFLRRRLPMVGAIVLASWCSAAATLMLQTAGANRILSPGILGIDAWYILIQSLAVFFFSSDAWIIRSPLLNLAVTLPLMLVYSMILFSRIRSTRGGMQLLLIQGIIMAGFLSSVTNYLQKIIDPNEFSLIQNRLFASVTNIHGPTLLAALPIFFLLLAMTAAKHRTLDVMLLGRDQSINLGLSYARELFVVLSLVSGFTALSTAVIGPLPFLGLVAVTLARRTSRGYTHRELLIRSMLISALVMMAGHLLLTKVMGGIIPLPPMLNVFGGGVFLLLLIRRPMFD